MMKSTMLALAAALLVVAAFSAAQLTEAEPQTVAVVTEGAAVAPPGD